MGLISHRAQGSGALCSLSCEGGSGLTSKEAELPADELLFYCHSSWGPWLSFPALKAQGEQIQTAPQASRTHEGLCRQMGEGEERANTSHKITES